MGLEPVGSQLMTDDNQKGKLHLNGPESNGKNGDRGLGKSVEHNRDKCAVILHHCPGINSTLPRNLQISPLPEVSLSRSWKYTTEQLLKDL